MFGLTRKSKETEADTFGKIGRLIVRNAEGIAELAALLTDQARIIQQINSQIENHSNYMATMNRRIERLEHANKPTLVKDTEYKGTVA